MGKIDHPVILKDLLEFFNINNYLETGVGYGDSLNEVFKLGIVNNFYGVELDSSLCDHLKNSSFGPYLMLKNGYSKDELEPLVISMDSNPTLFWLDAHFPGSDFNQVPYDSEQDEEKRIPLKVELQIISSKRNLSKDVIIIDDLRIYKDIPCGGGSWAFKKSAGADNCNFVYDILGQTHIIIENYKDQGYLLAFPINTDLNIINRIILN